jgi:hypothetical protein
MTVLERYREQAKWARGNAEKAEVPELRERWLNVAHQYDALAAELESKPGAT